MEGGGGWPKCDNSTNRLREWDSEKEGEVVQKCVTSFKDGPLEVCVVLSQNSVFTFSQSTPIAAAVMVALDGGSARYDVSQKFYAE